MFHDLTGPEADGAQMGIELWHPEQIAKDPNLSTEEKRTLLWAFASGDRAVIGKPTLRQLPNGAVVTLASILSLLRKLGVPARGGFLSAHNKRLLKTRHKFVPRRRRTRVDDDRPPPPQRLAAVA